jgi:hypothetical protein
MPPRPAQCGLQGVVEVRGPPCTGGLLPPRPAQCRLQGVEEVRGHRPPGEGTRTLVRQARLLPLQAGDEGMVGRGASLQGTWLAPAWLGPPRGAAEIMGLGARLRTTQLLQGERRVLRVGGLVLAWWGLPTGGPGGLGLGARLRIMQGMVGQWRVLRAGGLALDPPLTQQPTWWGRAGNVGGLCVQEGGRRQATCRNPSMLWGTCRDGPRPIGWGWEGDCRPLAPPHAAPPPPPA